MKMFLGLLGIKHTYLNSCDHFLYLCNNALSLSIDVRLPKKHQVDSKKNILTMKNFNKAFLMLALIVELIATSLIAITLSHLF